MSTWVWVLTYTILGTTPEHGTISKYQTQAECQQSLEAFKQDRQSRGQRVVGTCRQVLKDLGTNK